MILLNRIRSVVFILFISFGISDYSPVLAEGTHVQVIKEASSSDFMNKSKENLEDLVKKDSDVMKQFQEFLSLLQKGIQEKLITEEDSIKILNAVSFAAEKHKLQVRKNAQKTPYIIHPLGVACYVMEIGGVYEPEVIIGALLHDTLDDSLTSPTEIATSFGKKTAEYVMEMTGNKELSLKERKKQQIIQALHQSKGAAVIKLADKLHNLNTLMKDPPIGWKRDQIDQYFQWAQAVIENLPEINSPLKEAVHKTIAAYWQSQE